MAHKTRPAPPPLPPATPKDETDPPYPFKHMESLLRDVIDPFDGEPIAYQSIMNTFKWLVVNARKRHLLDEPFGEALDKCCELHQHIARLAVTIQYKRRLVNVVMGHTADSPVPETPDIDEEIKEISNKIKAIRVWGLKHLELVSQCPEPSTTLN